MTSAFLHLYGKEMGEGSKDKKKADIIIYEHALRKLIEQLVNLLHLLLELLLAMEITLSRSPHCTDRKEVSCCR